MESLHLNVMLSGHSMIDFEREKITRALKDGGNEVAATARRLVSRRAISSPGEFPGESSGATKRSIKIFKIGSRGGYVKVGPTKTSEMKIFYPAILYYGSKKNNLDPRANYMVAALAQKRDSIRDGILASMRDALVPA